MKFDFESLQQTEYFGKEGFSFPSHTPGKIRNDDLLKYANTKANREYRARNPEKARRWRAAYDAKLSPEEKAERQRRYQRSYRQKQKNRARLRRQQQRYRQKNREKVNEKNRRYRARKKAKEAS